MGKFILGVAIILLTSYWNEALADVCEDLANGVDKQYEMEDVNPCYECGWHTIGIDSRESNSQVVTPFNAEMSRLGNSESAWCTETSNEDDYLQINLMKNIKIAGVVLQGFGASWVTSFKMSYNNGDGNYKFIKFDGEVKYFQGNREANEDKEIKLPIPVNASSIRVYPVTSHNAPCLKVGVFACDEQDIYQIGNDITVTFKSQAMPAAHSAKMLLGRFGDWSCTLNVLEDCKNAASGCVKYKKNSYGCDTCECDEIIEGEKFEMDIDMTGSTIVAVKKTLGVREEIDTNVFKAAGSRIAKWTDYTSGNKVLIPYAYGGGLSSRAAPAIQQAITELSSKTCIQLVRRTNQPYFINFVGGSGCSSPVGKNRGGNRVSIGYGCEHSGTVVHEILHSLGFWHEQSRPDRDRYVKIISYNISPGMAYNFQKRREDEINSLGSPYDLNSVMHYHGTAFTRNGQATIVNAKTGRAVSGQRSGLSAEDIKQINRMYCGTTGTGQTTRPPVGTKPTVGPSEKCEDENRYCSYWAGIGECKKNPRYMEIKCKKSCGVCSGGKSCEDKNPNCPRWRSYCTSSAYGAFMKLNCGRTCRTC